MHDVTQAEVVLRALDASGDVAYRWNIVSDDIEWAGDICGLLGGGDKGLIKSGELYNSRINDEDLPLRLMMLNQHMLNGQIFECEYRLRRVDGVFIWLHERAATEFDSEGNPVTMAGLLRNVSGRKREENLLEHRVNFDQLTGHLNKTRLRESLQNALAYANRFGVSGAFLIIGIDKPGQVNDDYSEEVADAVVIAVSHLIERNIRIVDTIGRLEGDLFGVILPNCDYEGVVSIAGRVMKLIRDAKFDTPAGPVSVIASVGGVIFPEGIYTPQQAISASLVALRDARKPEGNDLQIYKPGSDEKEAQAHNKDMADRILDALKNDRILFAYQPVIDSGRRRIQYYETLIRMLDDAGEEIPAAAFVPAAEALGIIRQLDHRGLEIALGDLAKYPDIRLSLNLSGHTITDYSWLRSLVSGVKNNLSLAERLVIEITETTALEDFDMAARFISSVRALGCKVALDDFGSGFTSFKQMKSLIFDVVKIDGIFVRDIERNHDNRIFIKALLAETERLGVETVAECVENEEIARIVSEEGVGYLQGWYVGKPTIIPDWRK